ncbi:molybdopterin-guanine dinucleotide biosynthesis protein A [Thermaerobacter marianensis DSM 12885]|uniref:Probable molybdenum cofactor guanylyltransferase n=1 Tax=Thermaerobacter marianensis (strain ATCC 700841 / DSM 12885 / JCM 10246 / 7p75a) TaxID=644966 RepID=E6SGC1_THEM7|nr:molybdopterin-guanine dinucleotide biosynthesis protein A [Thermaerobacter marianensis DSM 12885]
MQWGTPSPRGSAAAPLPASGIILAGGESRRMGRDKAMLPTAQGPLLLHVARTLAATCAEVLVVDRPPGRYRHLGLPLVLDRFPGRGPLAGLHAGLEAMTYPYGLVVACDMPGLAPAVARFLVEQALAAERRGSPVDAVVPLRNGRPEPLLAVYARRLAPVAEALLEQGSRPLRALLEAPGVRVIWVDEADLRQVDPDLRSLVNVNTPAEWAAWQRARDSSG